MATAGALAISEDRHAPPRMRLWTQPGRRLSRASLAVVLAQTSLCSETTPASVKAAGLSASASPVQRA